MKSCSKSWPSTFFSHQEKVYSSNYFQQSKLREEEKRQKVQQLGSSFSSSKVIVDSTGRTYYELPNLLQFCFILYYSGRQNETEYFLPTLPQHRKNESLTRAPARIKAFLCYRFSAKTLNTVIISKNRSIWRDYLRNMSWTPATVF